MTNYYELKISINPNLEEIVSDIFFTNFDCEGIVLEEETYKDLEMTSTTKGTLRVFLNQDENYENMSFKISNLLEKQKEVLKMRGFDEKELGSWDFSLEEKENQDWSQKWKEKWNVTHVTEKITVVPSWIEYSPNPDEIIITLDPGCAFGTGTHQTTQLCMKALEKYMNPQDKVADIGTGSGILAILAMKLGASEAYGCDIDDTVIEVCYKNAKVNNVECKFELNTANKLNEKYDFICANILHNVLAEIMPDLKKLMKDNAKLALSGILDEKKSVVLDAIKENKLNIIDTISQDQWISFIVTKC
ncbi:MAG: 50S ribosomal protein L11 methyltransferase [bacterium]|nr:50S ribosomal protein L11 methyltransferase [bacterium]